MLTSSAVLRLRPEDRNEKSNAEVLKRAVSRARVIGMFETLIGCIKWAAVGFIVAFFLMKLYEGRHIHDDIPRPEFKVRQSQRAALILSIFAAMLSALVWFLVQKWG